MKPSEWARLMAVLMQIAVAARGRVGQSVSVAEVAGVEGARTASEWQSARAVLDALGSLWAMGLVRLADDERITLTGHGLTWAYAASAKAMEMARRRPELWFRMMKMQADSDAARRPQ